MEEVNIVGLLVGMIDQNNIGIALLLLAGVWYVRYQLREKEKDEARWQIERDKDEERYNKHYEMLAALNNSVNNASDDPDPNTRGISTRTLAAKSYVCHLETSKMIKTMSDELHAHRSEDAEKHTKLLNEIRDIVKSTKRTRA